MLNVIVIMGRLVADPDARYTANNVPVTRFRVAVDRSYVRQGAERETDFIDVVAWRSTGEFVAKYFRKGSMIAVQGSLQIRSYTDKNDIKRTAAEVVADNVSFCGSKRENENTYPSVPSQSAMPSAAAPAQSPAASYTTPGFSGFEEIEEDDDLPF